MWTRRLYTIFAASAVLVATGGFGPRLNGVGFAVALTPADCDADRIVFTSQKDVDSANCTAARGSVVIPASATGNITFDFLLTIGGDLLVEGCGGCGPTVTGVTSSNLTTVGGRVRIAGVPSLVSVVLPQLRRIDGALELMHLPRLTWLNIKGINRLGSFHLIDARALRRADIGRYMFSTDPGQGLKNITDMENRVVEVRGVGLDSLNGLVDFWDAKLFLVDDMPNLHSQVIRVGAVDEVRVAGNGNLTLSFWETGLSGGDGPFIERLVVSGVRHISPCLHPVVREFVAYNNTVEYLHFNFDQLRRIEVHDNPRLKHMVPWPKLNRFWQDILIHDNPMLQLSAFPQRTLADNRTAAECPDYYHSVVDQWRWFPNRFNSVAISADIDNTFFNNTFAGLYLNSNAEKDATKPRVLKLFDVESSNASFTCEQLDKLRTEKGAFPGEYSCQGQSKPAGGPSMGLHNMEACMRTVLGVVFLATLVLL